MLRLTNSLAVGTVISLWLAPPPSATACGWSGDVEMKAQTERESVVVGADGQPLSDVEIVDEWSAAWETNLGNLYRAGVEVPQDYGEAVRWYRKAAERGFADAQNNLGLMYERGLGVEVDFAESARWYRAAAERGDPRAQHSLGALYRDGRGVPQDLVEAALWIRRSAEQGHVAAIGDLASLYWEGDGLKRNAEQAYLWWKIAAIQGDRNVARQLVAASSQLSVDQITEATRLARRWKPRAE